MTTYDDNLLAARFAALAPEPLPGDWEDVVARGGGPTRLRHSGVLWRRRRLVVALATVALAAVVTASAIGSVRDFILDRGFLGLAPEGATPSTPESGELVLHYLGRSAAHAKPPFRAPLVQVWVYADGRVIWGEESGESSKPVPEGANELASGYLEQRLTPKGIEFMRSQIAEVLDRSRSAVETLPSDFKLLDPIREGTPALFISDPLHSGTTWGSVQLRDGDHFLGLHWMGVGGHSPKFEGTIATPEQISDLRRIDALLTDRESVLPESAWDVRRIRAYVPSHYAACFFPSPTDQSQLLSLLPTGAADLLRGKSPRREDVFAEYCFKLTTHEARKVAEALSGIDREFEGARVAYRLAGPEHSTETESVYFEPYFPDGHITCSACG